MFKCTHVLFRILSTILALGLRRRSYRTFVAEAFERHRLSILRPWTTTTDAAASAAGSQQDEKVILGWTYETRKSDDETYQVRVGWNPRKTKLERVVDEKELMDRAVDDQPDAVSVHLPYFSEETSLASSLWPGSLAAAILCRSPSMKRVLQGADVLELGSGLGLTGAVASKVASSTRLTDNDEDVLEAAASVFREEPNVRVERLDWREDEDPVASDMMADVIVASDVAYYYYLLRPLMDTVRRHLRTRLDGSPLWLCVGQANREAQWQLYHNLRDGCYNQLLDVHEDPWPGKTDFLLFRLELYKWRDASLTTPWELDGELPMAALVYDATPNRIKPLSLSDFDHTATDVDEESLYMTF